MSRPGVRLPTRVRPTDPEFRANAALSLKTDAIGALEGAMHEVGAARNLNALSAALHRVN